MPDQIMELLDGVGKLTNIDDFKFRYYKSFQSRPVSLDSLSEAIPVTKEDYEITIQENILNNFSNFFSRSYLESVDIDNDDIIFKKIYAEPLRLRIKDAGLKESVYSRLQGRIMIESRDMAEILFYTKYIGSYNITKIANAFVFENANFAVVLEKI